MDNKTVELLGFEPIKKVVKPKLEKHKSQSQVAAIDKEIERLENQRSEIQARLDEITHPLRPCELSHKRDEYNRLYAKEESLINERDKIYSQKKFAYKQIRRLELEQYVAKSNIWYDNAEDIQTKIKILKRKKEKCLISGEKKKVWKEIETLQRFLKVIERLKNIDTDLDAIKKLHETLDFKLNAKDGEISAVRVEIEHHSAASEVLAYEARSLYAQVDEIRKKLNCLKYGENSQIMNLSHKSYFTCNAQA